MKKQIEKPEVKIMKLEAMDVIATSGGVDTLQGATIQSLTTAGNNQSIGF